MFCHQRRTKRWLHNSTALIGDSLDELDAFAKQGIKVNNSIVDAGNLCYEDIETADTRITNEQQSIVPLRQSYSLRFAARKASTTSIGPFDVSSNYYWSRTRFSNSSLDNSKHQPFWSKEHGGIKDINHRENEDTTHSSSHHGKSDTRFITHDNTELSLQRSLSRDHHCGNDLIGGLGDDDGQTFEHHARLENPYTKPSWDPDVSIASPFDLIECPTIVEGLLRLKLASMVFSGVIPEEIEAESSSVASEHHRHTKMSFSSIDPFAESFDHRTQFSKQPFMTMEQIQDDQPFIPLWPLRSGTVSSVLRITQIPYDVSKSEILNIVAGTGEFSGSMQQLLGIATIHMIMERSTAKTLDCFIEIKSSETAMQLLLRFSEGSPPPRIRNRQISFHASLQSELMAAVFPGAKCDWAESQEPLMAPGSKAALAFRGIVTGEELIHLVKWARNPTRTRFAGKHPQRVYESMISLLQKYPWWRADLYTVQDRNSIFRATLDLVKALSDQLKHGKAPPPLDNNLLLELVKTGLDVPSFNELQRNQLVVAGGHSRQVQAFIIPLAQFWPFETLRCRPGANDQVVEYFAHVLNRADSRGSDTTSSTHATNTYTRSPFGAFDLRMSPQLLDNSFLIVSKYELDAVRFLIDRSR